MDVTIFLSSAVIAAAVAGFVTLRANDRKIAAENIIQQRQLWREKIRSLSVKICSAYTTNEHHKVPALYVELQLLLNPTDSDDLDILDTVWDMREGDLRKKLDIVLGEKLALLLKHDWERAKVESNSSWLKIVTPSRLPYKSFKNSRLNKVSEK
ncbi:hypothetical protein G3495_14050 [Shewanella baltica]|uniref:hypothetical protein n=1 Tax=Shewanella baltica TaxID=62322 RepID=UPI00217CDCE5|nr:hypothetical protein [Shewanella baltica]MCS6236239.1 hypothetical protein [Shewanella baltica]MCS6270648.1 hypothetical protein [Shewanella baltica]